MILSLVAIAELLGMSLWFGANAAGPQLRDALGYSAAEVNWLTIVVQLGFVAGTAAAALLNIADRWEDRAYFTGSALLGAAANALLLAQPTFEIALLSRFMTGVCLAGVYPPAMKMIATWFRRGRGFAIGTVVGALTVGKATPYLVKATDPSYELIVGAGSASAVIAALLIWSFYRTGPFPFARKPFHLGLAVDVLKHRPTRLSIAGYVGHMWELYAMWMWLPAFFLSSAEFAGTRGHPTLSTGAVQALAFAAIAMGALGCLAGGWAADRFGRARVVNLAMAVSGICCIVVGLLYGGHPILLFAVLCVWGFAVVADSAQFSAMVTEVAPTHAVGTALTLQTSLGFIVTMVSMQLIPTVLPLLEWRWTFAVLSLGPAAGIFAIKRLQRAS